MSLKRFRRVGPWRVALLLAVGAFVIAIQPAVEAGSAGRDFARCMQSCNAVRKACTDICKADCGALYPTDPAAQNVCTEACMTICIAESQECKEVCKEQKEDPSPEEP